MISLLETVAQFPSYLDRFIVSYFIFFFSPLNEKLVEGGCFMVFILNRRGFDLGLIYSW